MSFVIEQEYNVPPHVLFDVFTNASVLTRLSRGALAEVDLQVGGRFSLFSGSVTGEFVKIEKPEKIIQKWRFCDWKDEDYSTVTFSFINVKENVTLLKLTHENIPLKNKYDDGGVLERCKNGWVSNFLDNIEIILGYPKKK